ncbi:FAD-dependent oxidoreductase [Burkholderia cenocepacia]|uniref:FAD/NAD(P)-dependent oxidoreductase n=1 Tax=Burkholderia cenocepacia TaxID=95486 RepID=UPI00158A67A1|nr:NAD(P)/FAD-dependent oxidoreductase [Burkholderia cenocepacia]MBR8158296.1 FAD-dependent oxidoreductase [Burkholderia cenocepacia]HEB3530207.1 FAD-dependent oxidoreductase [Burkholderia cenocepacia]
MTDFDLVVLGGGPAGANAALAAAGAGLKVALFDENRTIGGQVYRAPVDPRPVDGDAEREDGDALRAAVETSDVSVFTDHAVWSIGGNYRIDAVGPRGLVQCNARALVVATGTTERVVPFDGWTTPGVIGLAAATILLKSQHRLPGRTTLVAGCGPLLAAVAAKTILKGGLVVGIADLAGHADWLRTLPSMSGRPGLLRQGFDWWRVIRRAGVPIHSRHTIVRVEPHGERLLATLARCDAAGRPIDNARTTVIADCVAVGHGLTPSTDVTRLLGASHRYSRDAGGWIASADDDGRTSRSGLYVAGDAAGIAGAAAAAIHGKLAGNACALDLSAPDVARVTERLDSLRRAYRKAARAGRAMARLMALRPGQADAIGADTIICRCEDVRRSEIDAAIDAGALDINQLKAWTRCGMGPCQGRTCGDIAGELLASRAEVGTREAAGCLTARAPLRPVPIGALTGTFCYDDIPIPQAAPL